MKKLFLTSSVKNVARNISEKIDGKELSLIFINTAAELKTEDLTWQDDDRNSLKEAGFSVEDYSITGKTVEQLRQDLGKFDVIYVSGGNTFYLLEKVRESGFSDVIREQVGKGKPYIGTSAGSQIVGPDVAVLQRVYSNELEQVPHLKDFRSIGLVDFVIFPHWGSEHFKDIYLNHRREFSYKEENKIIILNDWQYVEVKDDWYKIVDVRDK